MASRPDTNNCQNCSGLLGRRKTAAHPDHGDGFGEKTIDHGERASGPQARASFLAD